MRRTRVGADDLQSFLRVLEQNGELQRVTCEVDPVLEITGIATRTVREQGPALLFENVKGSPYPLAINVLGSMRRVELALRRHPAEVGEELYKFVERANPPSLKNLLSVRRTLYKLRHMRTPRVKVGPATTSEEPDLTTLPILKTWPEDGGRFITLGLVLTRDPATDRRNMGIYRMQVFTRSKTGMHWQIQKGGAFHADEAKRRKQELPVAAVCGTDPCLLLAAISPLPEGMDEVAFSGFLRGKPTPVRRIGPHGIAVPANAEFILEGSVDPNELRMEGPFGDHFGHYSLAAPYPVFNIHAIHRRPEPVYQATVVGKPPQEDRYLGDAVNHIFLPLLKVIQPEIADLWAYYEAGFHNLLVVSVKERYAREGFKTALKVLGEGQLALSKCVIIVPEGVDPRDWSAVLRCVHQRCDPQSDIHVIPTAVVDTLDFTSRTAEVGGKLIWYAAGPPGENLREVPEELNPRTVDDRVSEARLWGGTYLVVKVQDSAAAPDILMRLVSEYRDVGLTAIAAVSGDVTLDDRESVLWGIYTRFDPARDCVVAGARADGPVARWEGPLGIDATWKPGYPKALELPRDIEDTVTQRWSQYLTP